MDTDMIGIDSAEEMRKKIQAKIKEEKEKNIKNVINIRIKTIDEKNCKSVFDGLYDKYNNHFDTLNDYEKKYYSNVFNELSELAGLLMTERYSQKTKEEVIKDYINDTVYGITAFDDMDQSDQVEFCTSFDNAVIAPCLIKYMTGILNKTDV